MLNHLSLFVIHHQGPEFSFLPQLTLEPVSFVRAEHQNPHDMIHEVLRTAVQAVKGLSTGARGASVDGTLPNLAPASVDSIRPLQCRPKASRTRRPLA